MDRKDNQGETIDGTAPVGRAVATVLKGEPVFTGTSGLNCFKMVRHFNVLVRNPDA